MSNKKVNNNTQAKEETKVTNVENQVKDNENVQNPPAETSQPDKTRPTLKERIDSVKAGVQEFFDKDKHPIRHTVGKVAVKTVEVAAIAGATVVALAAVGTVKSNKDDDYDEDTDDQYDDTDELEDEEEDVIDTEAKEIDE